MLHGKKSIGDTDAVKVSPSIIDINNSPIIVTRSVTSTDSKCNASRLFPFENSTRMVFFNCHELLKKSELFRTNSTHGAKSHNATKLGNPIRAARIIE
jgi:hypothetical protein